MKICFFLILFSIFSGCSLFRKPPVRVEIFKSGERFSLICEKESPIGIKITNPGNYDVHDIKILQEGQMDFTTIDRILENIPPHNATDKQKVLAIFDFLTRYHLTAAQPPPNETEPHDPVKYFAVYGYGICDDHAKVFHALLNKAGIRSRPCGVKGHSIAEAFYENSWHMFDADYVKYYRYPDDERIVSFEEVLKGRDRIVDQNGGKLVGMLKKVYSSGGAPSYYDGYPVSVGHKALFSLEPGESVTFYKKGQFGYYGDYQKSRIPPYSNAIFTRAMDLTKEKIKQDFLHDAIKDQSDNLLIPLKFSSPFVGIGFDLQISCNKEIPLYLFYKDSEIPWEKKINTSSQSCFYHGCISSSFFQGQYDYVLYLKAPIADVSSLENITMQYTTQCAPIFCPFLTSGFNNLTVFFEGNEVKGSTLILEPVYSIDN